MHRRSQQEPLVEEEPLHKKLCIRSNQQNKEITPGAIITDNLGIQWRLGKTVGTGGFGQIFLASQNIHHEVKPDANYVAKVEGHMSGPLFVEINYYLRAAKREMIKEWKEKNKLESLGVPHFVASGSHHAIDLKSRFLILPRFEKDLEQIFVSRRRKFNLKTVLTLGIQIMDILEYIHSKGFIHSDIKASNLLVGNCCEHKTTQTPLKAPQQAPSTMHFRGCNPVRTCRKRNCANATKTVESPIQRNLRRVGPISYCESNSDEEDFGEEEEWKEFVECSVNDEEQKEESETKVPVNKNQVYLLDYGLASKYVKPNGHHKEYCSDNRRAHAGTTLFCSLDAHSGSQSRRSDLESLGYNMIYWLTSHLPWMEDIEDPELVESKKQKCMSDLKNFLQFCFGQYPRFMYEYLEYVRKMRFDTRPNYAFCKKLFTEALKEYGYKCDMCFDFENAEGWGQKLLKKPKSAAACENLPPPSPLSTNVVISKIYRQPLRSNLTVVKRALTRNKKANKSKAKRLINWSKILMDPEEILRNANKEKQVEHENQRIRRNTESSDTSGPTSLLSLDIWQLNPTPTMVQVYDRIVGRLSSASGASPKHRGDTTYDAIDGYTATMVAVYNRKKEREQIEKEMVVINTKKLSKTAAAKRPVRRNKNNTNLRRTKSAASAKKQEIINKSTSKQPTSANKKKVVRPSISDHVASNTRRITRSYKIHNTRY